MVVIYSFCFNWFARKDSLTFSVLSTLIPDISINSTETEYPTHSHAFKRKLPPVFFLPELLRDIGPVVTMKTSILFHDCLRASWSLTLDNLSNKFDLLNDSCRKNTSVAYLVRLSRFYYINIILQSSLIDYEAPELRPRNFTFPHLSILFFIFLIALQKKTLLDFSTPTNPPSRSKIKKDIHSYIYSLWNTEIYIKREDPWFQWILNQNFMLNNNVCVDVGLCLTLYIGCFKIFKKSIPVVESNIYLEKNKGTVLYCHVLGALPFLDQWYFFFFIALFSCRMLSRFYLLTDFDIIFHELTTYENFFTRLSEYFSLKILATKSKNNI